MCEPVGQDGSLSLGRVCELHIVGSCCVPTFLGVLGAPHASQQRLRFRRFLFAPSFQLSPSGVRLIAVYEASGDMSRHRTEIFSRLLSPPVAPAPKALPRLALRPRTDFPRRLRARRDQRN